MATARREGLQQREAASWVGYVIRLFTGAVRFILGLVPALTRQILRLGGSGYDEHHPTLTSRGVCVPRAVYCDDSRTYRIVTDPYEHRLWPPVRKELLRNGARLYPWTAYPESFLRFAVRLAERHDAALAAALGIDARYYDAPCQDGQRKRRFEVDGLLIDRRVLNTCHPLLQDGSNGSNMVDSSKLRSACGPDIIAFVGMTLFSTVPSLTPIFVGCPALVAIACSECVVDSIALAAIPPTLRSLRLENCHGLDDTGLAVALDRAHHSLVFLDIDDSREMPGRRSVVALRKCHKLAFLRIPSCNLRLLADALRPPLSKVLRSLLVAPLRSYQRTAVAPAALVDAIADRCTALIDVDGVRTTHARCTRRLNRIIASYEELAKLDGSSCARARELVLLTGGSLDPRSAKTLRSLGATLTSLVVCVELSAGDVAAIAACLPGLVNISLNGVLGHGDFYSTYFESDEAPGNHDEDLLLLQRRCPQLRVIDLSCAFDAAYAVFSEAAVANLASNLPHLTDIYLYELGRKWDISRIPTKDGRLRLHHPSISP